MSTVKLYMIMTGRAVAKLAAISAFFAICSILYGLINEWAYYSPRTLYYRSPRESIPAVIQPWTAVNSTSSAVMRHPCDLFVYNWTWPQLSRWSLRTYIVFVARQCSRSFWCDPWECIDPCTPKRAWVSG